MDLPDLAMFCLGAFVGAVVTYGLHLVSESETYLKSIVTILGAALGGAVLPFIDRFQTGGAIAAYCGGLLIALMWAYAASGARRIEQGPMGPRLLGWAHIAGVVLASAIAGFLFVLPALVQVWRHLFHGS